MGKLLRQYTEMETQAEAYAVVHYGKGKKGKVSRRGYLLGHLAGQDFYCTAEENLGSYFDYNKGIVELDNGVRVPLCNITKIEPIKTREVEVGYLASVHRDWFFFFPTEVHSREQISKKYKKK